MHLIILNELYFADFQNRSDFFANNFNQCFANNVFLAQKNGMDCNLDLYSRPGDNMIK